MVTVKGRMAVNVIHGRFGPFRVARLYCEIGNYVVRYDGLDQYDAGTYEGEFVIRDTNLRIRAFGVGKIIEPVAYLEDMVLDNVDECLQEPIPDAIPDPVEDDHKSPRSNVPLNLDGKAPGDLSHEELKQLFGESWPLGDEVKLDPTVGRSVLRIQCNYLDSIGYKFNTPDQVWMRRVS